MRYLVAMSADDRLEDLDRWLERERLERIRQDAQELAEAETISLCSGRAYEGRMRRVGRDWIELDALHPSRTMIVNAAKVAWVSGALGRVRPGDERRPRLGLRSAVQEMAETGRRAVIVTVAGDLTGVVARVFADHCEIRAVAGADASRRTQSVISVPFSSLEAIWVV